MPELSKIESPGLMNPLGIGVTNPSYPLHVLRADGASGTLSLSGATTTGGPSYIIMGNNDSAGVSGPNVIVAANRSLQLGVGNSFTAAGAGTFTPHLEIDSAGGVRVSAVGQGIQTIPAGGNIQSYRTFTGWNFKYLGFFEFRAGNQYLDIRLSTTADNIMYQMHVQGYLYNSGQIVSWNCGYTYNIPANSILNQYTINSGNSSIVNSYRTSSGNLCLKLNRGSSGYSEGYVAVYFHSFDAGTQNAMGISAFAQNNSAGNFY